MKSNFLSFRLKFLFIITVSLNAGNGTPTPNISDIFPSEEAKKNQKILNEYYESGAKQNSLSTKILDIILKSIIGAIFSTLVKDSIDLIKEKLSPLMLIKDLEKSSIDLLAPYKDTKLFLTETQRNFEDYLKSALVDFVKRGKNKPTESIVLFGGESGTGKSASMFTITNSLLKLEQNKKLNGFSRFIRWLLPNFLQGLLKIRTTKDGIYLVISGAYFYNYSNEQDKAASLFSNILDELANHIRNNKNKYFIIAIDEAEIITQEPFARILKIFTTQLSQLNKDPKHGYGLILMSTNYINACSETLSRRLFVLEFTPPSADVKLKTFLLYLEKHMDKKEYTDTIVNSINKWIKYCENFSHSDMENIVWLLKLKSTTTKVILTLEDLLEIIYVEWKKRNIIVNKAKKENLQLQELEALISKVKSYKNTFYEELVNEVDLDNLI
jgi:DNA polymerase III delta prime subunit